MRRQSPTADLVQPSDREFAPASRPRAPRRATPPRAGRRSSPPTRSRTRSQATPRRPRRGSSQTSRPKGSIPRTRSTAPTPVTTTTTLTPSGRVLPTAQFPTPLFSGRCVWAPSSASTRDTWESASKGCGTSAERAAPSSACGSGFSERVVRPRSTRSGLSLHRRRASPQVPVAAPRLRGRARARRRRFPRPSNVPRPRVRDIFRADARGAFNIAADPVLDGREIARVLRARPVRVSTCVLRLVARSRGASG